MTEYIKKLIKVLILPLLFGIGQVIIILIFTLFYNNNIYSNIKFENPNLEIEQVNSMYKTYYQSETYMQELSEFVNDNTIWIILISACIFLPIFINKYKKFKIKSNYKINTNIIYVIMSSISITVLLNILIIIFNNIFDIKTGLTNNKYILTLILSTGIIGPILEEFLFRGIVFNKLKQFNKENIAIILTTILFSLLHSSFTQIIYAFIIGYICIKLYQKTNSLIPSIIFHVVSNTLVTLMINYFVNLDLIVMLLEIILSLLIFAFSYKMMYKKIINA